MALAVAVAVVLVLVLTGVRAFWLARRSLEVFRRLARHPTKPIARLGEGPAEVAGVVRAQGEPLRAMDGTAIVASHVRVNVDYKKGSKNYHASAAAERANAVPVELTDASGAGSLDLGHVLLLGPTRFWSFELAAFGTAHPDLWAEIATKYTDVRSIVIEETTIADGQRVLASGEAVPDDRPAAGDGYRSAARRWRIVGREGHPIILAAGDEASVSRHFRRPAVLLAALGALSWLAAALLASATYVLWSYGG